MHIASGLLLLAVIPVNPADNVLHILLTVAALGAGLASGTRNYKEA